ncbi:MAG: M56 family metallopeptidase [Acidobacteria bacterium]|nr:M56 family metallopeptidase [Acidobacteriota bacterium]
MSDFFMTAEFSGLADLVVRATVLLLVALALQWLTHKGPALTRHNLWTLTFALLLILPALRLFGPSWDVAVLPQAGGPADAAAAVTELVPPVRVAPAARGTAEPRSSGNLTRLAFLVWVTGCGVALVSVGVAALRFHRLARVALPVENEAWLRQLEALRKQLAIRAEVRLVQGKEVVTPMTGGVWKPVILLPVSAASWSEERCRIVLAHELVHVRRRDALRQLAGRAVLAFYWFHPLSWVASGLAAARREEACDEKVLSFGVRPSEYAGHLLSLAEGRAPVRAVLSLPMAQQSRLERRIRVVLNPRRAGSGAALATAVTALAAGVTTGVFASVVDPIRHEIAPYTGSMVADASDPEDRKVGDDQEDCSSASDADRPCGRLFVAPVFDSDIDRQIAELKAVKAGLGTSSR